MMCPNWQKDDEFVRVESGRSVDTFAEQSGRSVTAVDVFFVSCDEKHLPLPPSIRKQVPASDKAGCAALVENAKKWAMERGLLVPAKAMGNVGG